MLKCFSDNLSEDQDEDFLADNRCTHIKDKGAEVYALCKTCYNRASELRKVCERCASGHLSLGHEVEEIE